MITITDGVGIQTTPQNFERRICSRFNWNLPGAFLNSVNERQKIRGATPEQKQTFRGHVAEEQSLAVDKVKKEAKGKNIISRG